MATLLSAQIKWREWKERERVREKSLIDNNYNDAEKWDFGNS